MLKWEGFLIGLFCLVDFIDMQVIHTSTGSVSGLEINVHNTIVTAYLGIPYARPPIGNLRFQPPIPIAPWRGIYNATHQPPSCMQPSCPDTCSEDCLYLNMWVPSNANKSSVMVYIYGGSFTQGSISMDQYNGSVICAYGDVIVVTINYRLGPFGFFCSGTDDARGNMGMKDQVLGLRWVKDNIEYFGGDPSSITIVGQSAGAISVSTHLVSPLTYGLMSAAICQSGAAFKSYMIVRSMTVTIKRSSELSEVMLCGKNVSRPAVMRCMRSRDATAIIIADQIVSAKFLINPLTNPLLALFTPCYGDDYLPNPPVDLLAEGKIHVDRIMIGNDYDEGSRFLAMLIPLRFDLTDEIIITLPEARIYTESMFRQLESVPSKTIADYYLQNVSSLLVPPKLVYDSIGDAAFHCPCVYLANSISNSGKTVYYYWFKYNSSKVQFQPYRKWMGVAHEMEVQYVFGKPVRDPSYLPEERKLSIEMIGCWTSFVKKGDPNSGRYKGAWRPYSSSNSEAVVLNPSYVSHENPLKEACSKLWINYI